MLIVVEPHKTRGEKMGLFGKDYKEIEEQKVICLNCKKPVTTKITPEWTSELCACGCLLWFGSRPDRPYGTRKFISKAEHDANKKIKQEQGRLKVLADQKGIDLKVKKAK